MTEENKENCNFQQNYNVFGLDDKPCCYLYHKYCGEIDSCYFKRCKRLEQENERLREELNLHLYGTDDKMIHTLYGQPIQYWIEKKEALDGANSLIKGYHLLIKKYKSALEEIKSIADKFDYWNNNLTDASNIINSIKDKINELI